MKAIRQWVWLCSNKTLFTKVGTGPELAHRQPLIYSIESSFQETNLAIRIKKLGFPLDVQAERIYVPLELQYHGTLQDFGGEGWNPALLPSFNLIQPIPGTHKPSTSKTS